jgi:predicted chitinase
MSWFDQAREQLSKLQATLYSLLAKVEAMFSESPPDAVVECCPHSTDDKTPSDLAVPTEDAPDISSSPLEDPPEKSRNCVTLTGELLEIVYGRDGDERRDYLNVIAGEINKQMENGYLNTAPQLINFLGQSSHEVGDSFRTSENFNYSIDALKKMGKFTDEEAETYGRPSIKPHYILDWNMIKNEDIKNKRKDAIPPDTEAHDGPIGYIIHGDPEDKDRDFRGRGMIHITHKYNYESFTSWHQEKYEDYVTNFVKNPQLVSEAKYAIRSAIWVWYNNANPKTPAKFVDEDKSDKKINFASSKSISVAINGSGILAIPGRVDERWEMVVKVNEAYYEHNGNKIENIFHKICGLKESDNKLDIIS